MDGSNQRFAVTEDSNMNRTQPKRNKRVLKQEGQTRSFSQDNSCSLHVWSAFMLIIRIFWVKNTIGFFCLFLRLQRVFGELLDSSWPPLVEILSFCETPERSCGLHCVTRASVQIGVGRDFFLFRLAPSVPCT